MDEQACPRCKTTKYRNPSLKFMVNVCGHSLCENCVDIVFVRGSGACPECNTALRRNNFRIQLFEDSRVEKEVDIRKKVLRDFNKKEDDFENLNDYNDYLEMIETIVYNLTNDIDVEDTKQVIEAYKRENAEQIKRNKTKLSYDEEMLEEMIEMEKSQTEEARKVAHLADLESQKEKKKHREALIDELMFSEMSGNDILAAHKREQVSKMVTQISNIPQERRTAFSSGIRIGRKEGFSEGKHQPLRQGEMYTYEAPGLIQYGPLVPPTPALVQRHTHFVRDTTEAEKGGGFSKSVACKRALQEAFCGLFYDIEILGLPSGEEASAFV